MSREFSITGTESQAALDVLAERFPQAGLEQASANVVFAAPDDEALDTPDRRAAVAAALADVQAIDDVAFVTDPFAQPGDLSPDGRIALATATYAVEPLSLRADDREELFAAGDAGR